MRSRKSIFDQTCEPRRAVALCAAAAVAASFALPAMAGDPPAANTQPAAETAGAPSAGMRVAVDPSTGKLRPLTAQEAKTLDDMTKAKADAKTKVSAGGARKAATLSAAPGEQFTTPSGAVGLALGESQMVDSEVTGGVQFTTESGAIGLALDDSQMVYSVVTRGADGKLEMECVTGKDEANKALNGNPQSDKNLGGRSDEIK